MLFRWLASLFFLFVVYFVCVDFGVVFALLLLTLLRFVVCCDRWLEAALLKCLCIRVFIFGNYAKTMCSLHGVGHKFMTLRNEMK